MNESTASMGMMILWDGCNLWSYVLPDDPSAEERAEETSGNAQQHGSR